MAARRAALRVTILHGPDHPIGPVLRRWARDTDAQITVATSAADTRAGGDLLKLISWPAMVGQDVRSRFRHALVVHASDLPDGRGWSPHIWQILAGATSIPVTLLEAAEPVDSGRIWAQRRFDLTGTELFDEINSRLFDTTLELMSWAVDNWATVRPRSQDLRPPTYFRRRTPDDSRLDPAKSLAEQFDLLRVADPCRYPATLDFRNRRHEIVMRGHTENERCTRWSGSTPGAWTNSSI